MSRRVPPLPGCRNCDQYTRTGLERKQTQVLLRAVSSGVRADIRDPTQRMSIPKRSMVIEANKPGNSSAKEFKLDDVDFNSRTSNTYSGHISDTIPLQKVSRGNMSDTNLLKVNTPSGVYTKKYKDREFSFDEQKNKLNGNPLLSISRPTLDPTLGMEYIPNNNKFSDKGALYEANRLSGMPMTYQFSTNKKLLQVTP